MRCIIARHLQRIWQCNKQTMSVSYGLSLLCCLPQSNHTTVKMKYDVFISYSRKDTRVVQIICKLFAENGITFWYDNNEIPPGDEFYSTIVDAIKDSRITLFVSSTNSNHSVYTAKEVAVAFNEGKYIIPYKIDASSFNKKLELVFSDINWIDAFPFEYSKAVKLVESIKVLLGKPQEQSNFEREEREIIDISTLEEPQSWIGKILFNLFKER